MKNLKKFEEYNDYKLQKLLKKRVRCIHMDDPNPVEPGTLGTISFIDDIGQIHVKWDDGRRLALIPGKDDYEILD